MRFELQHVHGSEHEVSANDFQVHSARIREHFNILRPEKLEYSLQRTTSQQQNGIHRHLKRTTAPSALSV